jgi:hypothetical protein
MNNSTTTSKPLSGGTIQEKRILAGIAGHVLSKEVNKSRAWLTMIEREYYAPPPAELQRLDTALNRLIQAKLAQLSAAVAV